MNYLRALWAYRGFILGSIKREFQSKYRNSLLGAAWTVINPLAMIMVYTVIFSQLMKTKIPGVGSTFSYSIYLCAGTLTWGLFAEITTRAQNTFLENANLLKKISFPRLCLPVIVVSNAGINFTIIFGLFTVFLLITETFPGAAYIAMLPLLGILMMFAVGLGMVLGVLNVFFRDVSQFFGIFIQFWFWLTPIVYPINALPDRVQRLVSFNPMSHIVNGFHVVMVTGQWPNWVDLLYPSLLAILLCWMGMRLSHVHSGDMVDEL
jgi:lipopolysaccharide transport system permease protein